MKAGFAKTDITVYEQDMSMLGWGQIDNRIRGVHTPLSARAMALQCDGRPLVMLTAELAFITLGLRQSVLRELEADGITDDALMLSATHTHSGPSGFSHHMAYNVSNYGYSPLVFHGLVQRFVSVIRDAIQRLESATLRLGQATIAVTEPVAFNRSVAAYNRNDGVVPVAESRPACATDRISTTLRVDTISGEPLGAVNWFGVHGTSIHADNQLIHPDNKGVAAREFEAMMPDGFVALFAQEASGDVSPNYRFDARRKVFVGRFDDDFASAEFNGAIQKRYAERAWRRAAQAEILQERLTSKITYLDLSGGAPVVMGLPMAGGTAEGPGPLRPVAPLLSLASRIKRRLGASDPRLPWISLERGAEGRFLGFIPMRLGFELVAPVEPMIAFVRAADKRGYVSDVPWVPPVLPVQTWQLGDFAMAALAIEPTTVAGRQLRQTLREASGAGACVLTTHANAYAGYLTTPSEFELQRYEGGASYFGSGALARLQDALRGESPSVCLPLPIDEDFLIAQRQAGRTGVTGRGTDAITPPPTHRSGGPDVTSS